MQRRGSRAKFEHWNDCVNWKASYQFSDQARLSLASSHPGSLCRLPSPCSQDLGRMLTLATSVAV